MRLYHFSSSEHWPEIQTEGVIKVTESNVSLTRPHAGPDVVWLTDDPEPTGQTWGRGIKPQILTVRQFLNSQSVPPPPPDMTDDEIVEAMRRSGRVPQDLIDEFTAKGAIEIGFADKTDIRIAVEIPDREAHRYSDWRQRHGVRNAIYRALRDSGGDPDRWWVVERPILRAEWIEAVEVSTGTALGLDVGQPAKQ